LITPRHYFLSTPPHIFISAIDEFSFSLSIFRFRCRRVFSAAISFSLIATPTADYAATILADTPLITIIYTAELMISRRYADYFAFLRRGQLSLQRRIFCAAAFTPLLSARQMPPFDIFSFRCVSRCQMRYLAFAIYFFER
jgi:hypothetical protein